MDRKGIALCVALLSGCGVSVRGEIDGETPRLRDAYFVQEDGVFEGGDGLIQVVISEVPNACETDVALWEELVEADDAEDLEEIWETYMPEDFWSFDLYLRVGDPSDSLAGEVVEGVGWDNGLDDDGQMYAFITHFTDLLDQEFWAGLEDDEDYFDQWYSDGGDLEIRSHNPDDKIAATFTTEAAQIDDGDNDGDVTVRFSAKRCAPMERYLFGDVVLGGGGGGGGTGGGGTGPAGPGGTGTNSGGGTTTTTTPGPTETGTGTGTGPTTGSPPAP